MVTARVVDSEWFFSDPDPSRIFTNILYINFAFVFLPCKCVKLLIMVRYKLFRGIFFGEKGIYIHKLSIFLRNCQILSVCQSSLFLISDSAKSFRSDRIRIFNTALYVSPWWFCRHRSPSAPCWSSWSIWRWGSPPRCRQSRQTAPRCSLLQQRSPASRRAPDCNSLFRKLIKPRSIIVQVRQTTNI